MAQDALIAGTALHRSLEEYGVGSLRWSELAQRHIMTGMTIRKDQSEAITTIAKALLVAAGRAGTVKNICEAASKAIDMSGLKLGKLSEDILHEKVCKHMLAEEGLRVQAGGRSIADYTDERLSVMEQIQAYLDHKAELKSFSHPEVIDDDTNYDL